MATDITLGSYTDFDEETALSIYLFGEERAQDDFTLRVRYIPPLQPGTTVHIDMGDYMTSGAETNCRRRMPRPAAWHFRHMAYLPY